MIKLRFIVVLCFLGGVIWAQETHDDVNYSPYTVINNFNSNLQEDNYKPKLAALSFEKNDTIDREDAAIELKKILDGRGIVLENQKVPNDPNYSDSIAHQFIYQLLPSEKRIYLEKKGDKWFFSAETVADLSKMYNEVYMINLDPNRFFKGEIWKTKIFNISLASWVLFFGLILVCIGLYKLLSSLFNTLVKWYAQKRSDYNSSMESYIRKMGHVFGLFIVSKMFIDYLPSIQLPLGWNSFLIKAVGISSVVFLVLFINRVIDAVAFSIKSRSKLSEKVNDQILPITQKVLKIIIWIIGFFYILYYYLNVDPTALIAGLSIGGLAIALAAQDTVKNFLGSAIILIDKPFEVNDWIQFDVYEGIVEEVGIRSTRIRSFEDSVIYVPNSTISTNVLNNKGLRKYRRMRMTLGVEYDTPPEIIDQYVANLIQLIKNHPDTVKYKYDVYLNDLGESSINIIFNCFFSVADSTAEFKARHQLLSQIITLSRDMGVEFAFPSRSLYIESDNNFGATPRRQTFNPSSPENIKAESTAEKSIEDEPQDNNTTELDDDTTSKFD